ncbi:hypothetical protein ACSBR2_012131 [Camellia fascicularis]
MSSSFRKATREHAPSIIFMDEIDNIGSARMESGSGNGDSEMQQTMLELLNQLDRFEASNKIKVLMATNRIDILDQALLRPGRIDMKIEFPNPNEEVYFIHHTSYLYRYAIKFNFWPWLIVFCLPTIPFWAIGYHYGFCVLGSFWFSCNTPEDLDSNLKAISSLIYY